MKFSLLFCIFSPLALLGFGNGVKVNVDVVDDLGYAVSNAAVTVVTQRDRFSGFLQGEEGKRKIVAEVNENGHAVVAFQCWSGDFHCYVSAPNHYPEAYKYVSFKTNGGTFHANLLEHEKTLSCVLYRKLAPKPMYTSRVRGNFLLPVIGKPVGYDMQVGDWTPPYGSGQVSDFTLMFTEIHTNGCWTYSGELSFAPGAGAYRMKNLPSTSIWASHLADTNAVYESTFVSTFKSYDDGRYVGHWKDILGEDEHMIVRTRVVRDTEGHIVKCNYAKMKGPLKVRKFFSFRECTFNPNVNDPSLEDDYAQNLFPRARRRGHVVP